MFFKKDRDPLDRPIGWWAKGDPLTKRHLLQSTAIFGATGSGKSSGAGRTLRRAVVQDRDTAGLILAAKPEDKDEWAAEFARAGREDDLLVIEPGGRHRCNVLEHEMKHGADTRDLTQFMMTVQETVDRASGNASREPFWAQQTRRKLYNALEVVKRATGRLDPWQLQVFITEAATNPVLLGDPETIKDEATRAAALKFQASSHKQALQAAYEARLDEIATHDVRLATRYWLAEEPNLDPRTRGNINANVLGLLHIYNTGIVRHLLATETTVSTDDLERRKWILVNMPIVAGDASATFVNTAMKYLVQRHILRRRARPGDPIIVIFCDEFPKCANSYDTAALAEIRGHLGCMITIAQSMPAMCEALGSDEHRAHSLLCNQFNKVFHLLGDASTASFASSLLGNERRIVTGGSIQPQSVGEELHGRGGGWTANFNEQVQPVLEPSVFLSGLRTGGAACGHQVDAILVRAGAWRYVTFDQRS